MFSLDLIGLDKFGSDYRDLILSRHLEKSLIGTEI